MSDDDESEVGDIEEKTRSGDDEDASGSDAADGKMSESEMEEEEMEQQAIDEEEEEAVLSEDDAVGIDVEPDESPPLLTPHNTRRSYPPPQPLQRNHVEQQPEEEVKPKTKSKWKETKEKWGKSWDEKKEKLKENWQTKKKALKELASDDRFKVGWLRCNIAWAIIYFVAMFVFLGLGVGEIGDVYADFRMTKGPRTYWSAHTNTVPLFATLMCFSGSSMSALMAWQIWRRKDKKRTTSKDTVHVRMYRFYWIRWGTTTAWLFFGLIAAMDSAQVLTIIVAMLLILNNAKDFWISNSLRLAMSSPENENGQLKRFQSWNTWLPLMSLASGALSWIALLPIMLLYDFSSTTNGIFITVVCAMVFELALETFVFQRRLGLNHMTIRTSIHQALVLSSAIMLYAAGTFSPK